MLNPWLLLGSVAFAVSFGISLLAGGDLGRSLIVGLTGLGIAYGTAATVNRFHNRSADSRIAGLKSQIRLLQRKRTEEQQAVLELSAEKEQVAQTLNSMQQQLRQQQLPGIAPIAQKALSWSLGAESAEPGAAIAERIGTGNDLAEPMVQQFLENAAATKQKIIASLNHLQGELGQLNTQIAEQRQTRDRIAQEIQTLTQQRQNLAASSKTLTAEVEELERCRVEVDQYLSYVETKKQELETGANPLQKALKQLQGQVNALQAELHQLETSVTTQRQEKERLDRELAATTQNKERLDREIAAIHQSKAQLNQEILALNQEKKNRVTPNQPSQANALQVNTLQETLQKLETKISDRRQEKESLERQITQLQAQKTALRTQPPEPGRPNPPRHPAAATMPAASSNGKEHRPPPAKPTPARQIPDSLWAELAEEPDQPAQELSDLWTDFMVQLSEYEFQALRAIAHESNPLRLLSKLAEDSFTSTDELVDAINQRAEDIVGETVIKPQSNQSPPAIVRDHQRTIKKLIETYEYLTQ